MASSTFIRALVAEVPPVLRIASAADLRGWSPPPGVTDTVERAALAGSSAAGLGWAFAGGYQAALAKLDPALGAPGSLAALCATEEGGGHPRAIETTLVHANGHWTVSGRKAFVTLGADADLLLVVARTGQDAGGRSILRAVRIPARRAGVSLEPGDPLPFAPDIGHAAVTLNAVALSDDELLPGDGYETVLKPFRTIEDIHVTAAALGWLIGIARASGWDRGLVERALALIVLLRAVNAEPPLEAETHLVLNGAMAGARHLLAEAPWPTATGDIRDRWERDRPLLDVASRVRAQRTEVAWRASSAWTG